MYEKFCYLNGFQEKDFDDYKSQQYLQDKGFELVEKQQTEYFQKIILKKENVKIKDNQNSKNNSLQLFIYNSCSLTNFMQDIVQVSEFNQKYSDFCQLNHLDWQTTSSSELLKEFNIISSYLPEKWVVQKATSSNSEPTIQPNENLFKTKIISMFTFLKQFFCCSNQQHSINIKKVQTHLDVLTKSSLRNLTKEEL